jgi:hypothetical protein
MRLPVPGTGMRTRTAARDGHCVSRGCPGVPGCGAASTVTSCRARIGRHCGRGLPSANAWFTPVRAVLLLRLRCPLKASGLTVSGFRSSRALDDKLLRDKHTVNVRPYSSRIAALHVDKLEFLLHAHGVYRDLPCKSPVMGVAGRRDPSISTGCAQGSAVMHKTSTCCAHKACCCAVASKICVRPIRPCGHRSCDGAAPSLAGEYTDGLASARGRGRCRAAGTWIS